MTHLRSKTLTCLSLLFVFCAVGCDGGAPGDDENGGWEEPDEYPEPEPVPEPEPEPDEDPQPPPPPTTCVLGPIPDLYCGSEFLRRFDPDETLLQAPDEPAYATFASPQHFLVHEGYDFGVNLGWYHGTLGFKRTDGVVVKLAMWFGKAPADTALVSTSLEDADAARAAAVELLGDDVADLAVVSGSGGNVSYTHVDNECVPFELVEATTFVAVTTPCPTCRDGVRFEVAAQIPGPTGEAVTYRARGIIDNIQRPYGCEND